MLRCGLMKLTIAQQEFDQIQFANDMPAVLRMETRLPLMTGFKQCEVVSSSVWRRENRNQELDM